jgi:hypothetical protein
MEDANGAAADIDHAPTPLNPNVFKQPASLVL